MDKTNDMLNTIRDLVQVRMPNLMIKRYESLVFAVDPTKPDELGGEWPHSYVGATEDGLFYVHDADDRPFTGCFHTPEEIANVLVGFLTAEIASGVAQVQGLPPEEVTRG